MEQHLTRRCSYVVVTKTQAEMSALHQLVHQQREAQIAVKAQVVGRAPETLKADAIN